MNMSFCSHFWKFFFTFFLIRFTIGFSSAFSQQTELLSENKFLQTPIEKVWFLNATQIKRNSNGDVIQGTLAKTSSLWTGSALVSFQEGTTIIFNDMGKVISGVLAHRAILWTAESSFLFEGGTTIQFNQAGRVIEGCFAQNTAIQFSDKAKNLNEHVFMSGKPISFFDSGRIKSGYILEENEWNTYAGKISFMAETLIVFDEIGIPCQGILARKTTITQPDKSEIVCHKGTFIQISNDGTVVDIKESLYFLNRLN